MAMKKVRDVLAGKGSQIWSVAPEDTVFDAIRLMAEKHLGALIVLEQGRLVGIVSERDYARKVILRGRFSHATLVRDIMSENVICARTTQAVEESMAVMTDKRIRHLPVLENDTVVGMVSIGDLVKTVIAEQKFVIDQLEHYITGQT
jgi:CBS domain-containing protein